jgi:putative ABC transport system permease protein
MRPLSILKYARNNILKTLPVFISMTVGVFLIYFFTLITLSSKQAIDMVGYSVFTNYTIVHTTDYSHSIPEILIDKMNTHPNTDKVIPLLEDIGNLHYESVFGFMSFTTLNLYPKDMPEVISNLEMKLLEGSLPGENLHEIAVPKKFAVQNKLSLGDYIGREVDQKYNIAGRYKISGIIDGPSLISITNNNNDNIGYDTALNYSLLLSLKDNTDLSLIHELNAANLNKAMIISGEDVTAEVKQTLVIIDTFAIVLAATIILVLCISLGNLNYITFLNRKYEFGVLSAIGYKKSTLYFKLWKENSLICISGYSAGILLSSLIAYLLNVSVFEPVGKYISIWNFSGAILALLIPAFVSLFSLAAPMKELKKSDPIEVLSGMI